MGQIEEGTLKRGGKLPSERDLALQMGVGRPSVREALIALELLGVVEIRIGQGTYVVGAPASVATLQSDLVSPFDLLEARAVIESNVVVLLARKWNQGKVDEQNLRRACAITDHMSSIVADNAQLEEFYQLGLDFHKVLAASSSNEILSRMVGELVEATSHPLWALINRKILQSHEVRENMIREHEAIISAIKKGDEEGASRAMQHHIEDLEKWGLE